jgi:hypothetical protein
MLQGEEDEELLNGQFCYERGAKDVHAVSQAHQDAMAGVRFRRGKTDLSGWNGGNVDVDGLRVADVRLYHEVG